MQWKAMRKRRDVHKLARLRNFISYCKSKPCMDCNGWFKPWQMDFDHRPGVQKLFHLSQVKRHSFIKVIEEMAKCDLVCANCHRDRTHTRLAA